MTPQSKNRALGHKIVRLRELVKESPPDEAKEYSQELERCYQSLAVTNQGFVRSVIYDRYRGRVPDHILEDLVSEGNLGLLRAAQRWDPTQAAFTTYSRAQILGRASQYLRKETRLNHFRAELKETSQEETIDGTERSLLGSEVWSLLETLPEHEGTVLRYRFEEDLSLDEIAVLMDSHQPTIRLWLSKGIERLREMVGT